MGHRWIIGLALSAGLLAGCPGTPPSLPAQPGTAVTATPIAQGGQAKFHEARTVVVRTAGDWRQLWQQTTGTAAEPPAVDFGKDMVVGVYLGERLKAGFAVAIADVRQTDGKLTVTYRETVPGPDDLGATVLTYPYVLAKVPRTDGEVVFQQTP